MTETHDQLPAQLRFHAARWNTYGRNLGWQVLLVAVSVFLWAFVAVLLGFSQDAVVVTVEILGVIVALFFTAIALAGPLSYVWDARRTWCIWHQLRRPVVVIDGTGIRYEPESGQPVGQGVVIKYPQTVQEGAEPVCVVHKIVEIEVAGDFAPGSLGYLVNAFSSPHDVLNRFAGRGIYLQLLTRQDPLRDHRQSSIWKGSETVIDTLAF